MVKFLIHRPVSVAMAFVALLILGVISYQKIPLSLLPDIDIPEITVQVSYPDYTAREIEDLVVAPLCDQYTQCANIEDVKSDTRDGAANIRLRFKYGVNIGYAYMEANEKTDQGMSRLPQDLERPRVIMASATDIPVLYVNIALNDSVSVSSQQSDFIEMSRFVENVVAKRIEQLPEIALVDITGTDEPIIEIVPDEEVMQSLNITYRNIENALSAYNYRLGNVSVRDGDYIYSIRFANQLITTDDIRNIHLNIDDRIILLKDIAKIDVKATKQSGIFTTDNKRGISLAIIKQADAKMDELKDSLTILIQKLQRDYPQLSFETTQDQTSLLEYSINNLKTNLYLGAIFAIGVVFLFISNWRLPVIIGIIVPISLILSFIFLMLMNVSVNIVSLSGLVLGVGMMIDNSIIVIDNITQCRERGMSPEMACINGTNEVIRPLLSSALTTCAVFIPLVFVSGIAGALFYDQAVAVSVGLGVSVAVAITLIPVIYYFFFKKQNHYGHAAKSMVNFRKRLPLEKIYEKGVEHVFSYPITYLIAFMLFMGMAAFMFSFMEKERFPKLSQKDWMVQIDWNEQVNIAVNQQRIDSLLRTIKGQIAHYNAWIGQQKYLLNKDLNLSSSEATIYLEANSVEALDSVRNILPHIISSEYPQAEYTFSVPENIFEKTFSDKEYPFVVQVSGKSATPEPAQISSVYNSLDSVMGMQSGNRLRFNSYIALAFNPEKLIIYNISLGNLTAKFKTLLNDYQVGTLKTSGEIIPLKITGDKLSLREMLETATVKNADDVDIPLRCLVEVSEGSDFKQIHDGNNGEFFPVSYQVNAKEITSYENKVKQLFSVKHKNFEYSFSGSIYSLMKILKELWLVRIISLVLLYLILASQFESLTPPLIVLLEIPIDIAGMLLLLYATGQSLNIMSTIGIIVMCGIVINDSILKIDTINRLRREESMSLIDAIKEGGKRRLRPILMTSLTAMLALVPGLFGSGMGAELQKPFSTTIVGGLFLGTLVSIFFIPIAYWFIYRNSEEKEELKTT
ncbi:MAG TPA: efflux RND transporter permease subunit [Prolixibacteraceae bacterium]|nr:efflux RND transporter permease subunit [Prolixibacteraceae bacterium]